MILNYTEYIFITLIKTLNYLGKMNAKTDRLFSTLIYYIFETFLIIPKIFSTLK